jgi:hypothetical protein
MKLTWFAGTTIRIHVGGRILVADPRLAPPWVDRRELISAADRTFTLAAADPALAVIDPVIWRRRRPPRALDHDAPPLDILRLGNGAVLVDAPGEPLLVLLATATLPPSGRWMNDTVIVLFGAGEAITALGTVLLDTAEPRLLALAADEPTIESAIAELREHLDGTALVSLEPGLALEA